MYAQSHADSAGVGDVTYPSWVEELTPAQRQVLQKPNVQNRRAKM